MSKLFKEPLVQFLLGGALLYVMLSVFMPEDGSEQDSLVIQLDEGRLLTYLQYQDKAFDTAQARRVFESLDAQARQKLEDEFVRDEIMVREALALGLDQNDDVIDQRLIQKMDFIFQGFTEPDQTITDADLLAYFEINKTAYREDAQATFTHVFFKTDETSEMDLEARARDVLQTLKTEDVPFEDAGQYGERFYFLKNYVNRPQTMIKSHFGAVAANAIMNPEVLGGWFGPLRSDYGLHLVFVRSVEPSRIPDLSEVTDQVRMDVLRERRDAVRRAAFEKVAQKYTVQRTAEK